MNRKHRRTDLHGSQARGLASDVEANFKVSRTTNVTGEVVESFTPDAPSMVAEVPQLLAGTITRKRI